MRNVAKLNLEFERCVDCPYCTKPDDGKDFCCQHKLKKSVPEVGDGERVPDSCPFVIMRLQEVMKTIRDGTSSSIPKKFIVQIERKQKDDPNPKFFADHGWEHIRRVTAIGKRFLDDCVIYGYSSEETVEKEKLLFEIAAYMHDIGLADTFRNHEIHSEELAKKYLSGPKIDIDIEDACTITHAIYNHSKGEETDTIIDAALILADKLDMTAKRVARAEDDITREMLKIQNVEFKIVGESGIPRSVELRYETEPGFKPLKLKDWPKAVSIPYQITTEFLGLSEFKFIVNNEEVDIKEIIS